MKSIDEMARNAKLMKQCNRIYNTVVTVYAVICAFYAGVTLFMLFLGQALNPLPPFIDGIILKGALFFCGLMACYKHDTKYTLFAIVIMVISVFISDAINGIIAVVTVILSVVTAYTNRQYHYLENQFGFPYFNERFEEQNLDIRQSNIKDSYRQNYERMMKTSSADMDDVSTENNTPDSDGKQNNSDSDLMDSI